MNPPTTFPGSTHMQGPPAVPLPTGTARGTALALGALLHEALSGRPQRLVWCIDSERDVGVPAVDNERPDLWLDLLNRFKVALDRLAWGPSEARLAVALRTKAVSPSPFEALVFHGSSCALPLASLASGSTSPWSISAGTISTSSGV